MPFIIKKMKMGGMVGRDINKINKPEVAEMGGIGGYLGFSLGATITVGILKLYGYENEVPILVAISVFSIAIIVGLFDDIAILTQGEKAIFIILASLPLMISTNGVPEINYIVETYKFDDFITRKIYWVILVPIGISGMANALNMSAGYNGLESGQFAIIAFFLIIINYIKGGGEATYIIFGCLFGSSVGLFIYNRFPAQTFVGDVGTLGFGATLAAGIIMANIEIFGIICIIPAFYEFQATVKYKLKNIERRQACHNPIITDNGILIPPSGAECFTLFYKILSIRPMTEKNLVLTTLMMYFICGIIAVVLCFV